MSRKVGKSFTSINFRCKCEEESPKRNISDDVQLLKLQCPASTAQAFSDPRQKGTRTSFAGSMVHNPRDV